MATFVQESHRLTKLSETNLNLPDDCEAVWDLDGCTIKLPGPGMQMRESAGVWGALVAMVPVLLIPLGLLQGAPLSEALFIAMGGALAMGLMAPVFIGLGGFARRRQGVQMRIEPTGKLTYVTFGMEVPLEVRMSAVERVEVPESGPPRVVVHAKPRGVAQRAAGMTLRFRTWEHTRKIADAIERARPADPSAADAVPETLRAMRRKPEVSE